jgi:hypothetical protein
MYAILAARKRSSTDRSGVPLPKSLTSGVGGPPAAPPLPSVTEPRRATAAAAMDCARGVSSTTARTMFHRRSCSSCAVETRGCAALPGRGGSGTTSEVRSVTSSTHTDLPQSLPSSPSSSLAQPTRELTSGSFSRSA